MHQGVKQIEFPKKNNEKINKFLTNRFKYLDDQNFERYPSKCKNQKD